LLDVSKIDCWGYPYPAKRIIIIIINITIIIIIVTIIDVIVVHPPIHSAPSSLGSLASPKLLAGGPVLPGISSCQELRLIMVITHL
jgi:hypothetical protein